MSFFKTILSITFPKYFHILLLVIVVISSALIISSCDSSSDVSPEQGEIFIKLFGGNGSEEGKDLALLPDGGFVMVGSSTSSSFGNPNGGKDVYIARTDNIGNVIWQSNFGGFGDDIGNSVIVDDVGNILVCGEKTQDYGTNNSIRDTYVIKLSADGGLIGEYTFGDSLRDEFGTDILDISDAGYLITSTWETADTSKYFIIETDANLVPIDKRSRYISGSSGVENFSERSYERTNISDLEPPFVCFGSAQQQLSSGAKVFKFQSFYYRSNDDDAISEFLYGPDNSDSYCTDVKRTIDGGYIMCGYNDAGGVIREMVVRLNSRREMIGEVDIIDYEITRNIVSDPGIFQTNDGGFIIISTIELDDPLNDEISLLKLNSEGDQEWRKTYGSNDNDIGENIIQLEDGSFLLIGTIGFEINPDSQSKMCLMKINPNGELIPL